MDKRESRENDEYKGRDVEEMKENRERERERERENKVKRND
jgi:hypothetical protein